MKSKLVSLGLIALCISIYFIILFPYDNLYFSILPTYAIFGDSSIIVANIIMEIFLVAVYFLCVYLIKKAPPLKLWNQAGLSVISGAAALFMGVSTGLYTVCFFKLPYTLDHFPMYNQLLITFFGKGTFIAFALFCITSSVFKEVLFRGVIMNELKAVMPVTAAIILQAVIYGIANFFQQNIQAIVFACLGAAVFGLLYYWSKNIFITMFAQLGNIITIITLTMSKDSIISRTTSAYALAPSIIVLLALGYYFFRIHKINGKKAIEKEKEKEPQPVGR